VVGCGYELAAGIVGLNDAYWGERTWQMERMSINIVGEALSMHSLKTSRT